MNIKTMMATFVSLVTLAGVAKVDTAWQIDDRTGAIRSLGAVDGRSAASEVQNRYYFMLPGGVDVNADEREDAVIDRKTVGDRRSFTCTNPKFPGIEVVKTYYPLNGGLHRTLEFRRIGPTTNTVYVIPFVEFTFAPGFADGLWHLGAGYIGPYKPFPKVAKARPVNEFKQSSKGLVLVHPKSPAMTSFAHFRTKIDDTPVLPWWHSTIGRYREYADRLWYLPTGYKFGLGTFDIRPGKSVSVTDHFVAFDGGLFQFFDQVFAKDPDFAAEIAAIPPAPEWIQDLASIVGQTHDDFVRWLGEMLDDCQFLGSSAIVNSWADYRLDDPNGLDGNFGGRVTPQEMRDFVSYLRRLNPRLHPDFYAIVIAAGRYTRILQEHPEWFRRKDRDGNDDSLFPGLCENYQTLFSNPECRRWLVDMLTGFSKGTDCDICYTDEMQMTNTIDWEHDRITRDDDSVKFWRLLKRRLHDEGIMYFANGSGIPYADLNFMESPHEMQPKRWRDWVGVALGIGMINRLKPGNRTAPLYWTGGCDYANRFLALGWIPSTYARQQCLHAIRAGWQIGHMEPIDARYAPDWKTDFDIEVESHSMRRRNSRDVMLSFINRGATNDLPIAVELESLGFGANERINVWRAHFDEDSALRLPKLSNAELRHNWRAEGSIDGATLTAPELVYSGLAKGTFRQTIEQLGTDKMEQFLITAAPVQFFAANDLVQHLPFTTAKGCRINGKTVSLERRADLLFADLENDFTELTANGQPVASRAIALGGKTFRLVTLEPGQWQLGWRTASRKPDAQRAELPSAPKYRKSAVRLFKNTRMPATNSLVKVSRKVGGVSIIEERTYQCDYENDYALQCNISAGITVADSKRLVLEAGSGRRDVRTRDLRSWAGWATHGIRQLRVRFSHTFKEAHANHNSSHTWPWNGGPRERLFTGIVIDYRTKAGYVKRVSMSTGVFSEKCVSTLAPWGKGKAADEQLYFGEWIDDGKPREFTLDIAEFAPSDWDGWAYVSLGVEKMAPGRRLRMEVLGFNDEAKGNVERPRKLENIRDTPPPVTSKPLKSQPRSLTKLYREEWDKWTKLPGHFTRLVQGAATKDSTVFVAHDYEYLYVGVECKEDDRGPVTVRDDPLSGEHIELCIVRPDGKVVQINANVLGNVDYRVNHASTAIPKRLVCNGENGKGHGWGWRVFFAVPVDELKFDMQRTPVTIKANVCRVRQVGVRELTSWAPMAENGFFDLKRYGTWVLDFNWSSSATAGKGAEVSVDWNSSIGPVKPVNGVGQPPMIGALGSWPMFSYLKRAGIPYSRLHDVGGWLGGGLYVDIPNLFPDFSADENDPKNYRFAFTDSLMVALDRHGVEPFFRLGVTIENFVYYAGHYPPQRTMPPSDYAKWARICEHVIRHYTEGWADGYHLKVNYWEIWNEPENNPDSSVNPMWHGDWQSYMDFYGTVAPYLKSKFPHLKIGGYGHCGFYAAVGAGFVAAANSSPRKEYFVECAHKFLKAAKEKGWPLDFFSYHSYSAPVEALRQVAVARDILDRYGFTKTETCFNEWLPLPSKESRGSAHQAAMIAAELVGLQNGPCDTAMIYDARCGTGNYSPLFNPLTEKPHPAYFAFLSFNELRKLKTAVRATSTDSNLWVAAARDGKRGAIMLANYSDRAIPFELKAEGLKQVSWNLTSPNHLDRYFRCKPPKEIPADSFVVIFFNEQQPTWEKPKTTRRYLHGPLSSRVAVMFREGKVTLGDCVHVHDWQKMPYSRVYATGLWLTHGDNCEPFDFREAKLKVDPEAVPICAQSWRVGDLELEMESCAPFERNPNAHVRVRATNRGTKPYSDVFSFLMRYGEEGKLVCGAPDGYIAYDPDVREWFNCSSYWKPDGTSGVFRENDNFIAFGGLIPSTWDGRLGVAKFVIDLKPGETRTIDCVIGRHRIEMPHYDEVRAKVRADWLKELEPVKGRSALVRNLTVQMLQCFARPSNGDYVLPRQGGLQRWVWPGDNRSVCAGLDLLGYHGYVDKALDFYFGQYQQPSGEVGKFGNGWASDTASVLLIFARHAIATGDVKRWRRYRDAAVKAFGWIRDTRMEDGLFPPLKSADSGSIFRNWGSNDCNNLDALDWLARAAERFNDPVAAEVKRIAADYRATINRYLDRWRQVSKGKDEFFIPFAPDGADEEKYAMSFYYSHPGHIAKSGFFNEDELKRIHNWMVRNGIANAEKGLYMVSRDGVVNRGAEGNFWYLSWAEHDWFKAWRRVGRDDLARQAIDTCLKFAMTDEYMMGERYHAANPWLFPWSPNASACGRVIQMISELNYEGK